MSEPDPQIVHTITGKLMERFPMLDPAKAGEMAEIAVATVAEPVERPSGLKLCRVCRAPLRPEGGE